MIKTNMSYMNVYNKHIKHSVYKRNSNKTAKAKI